MGIFMQLEFHLDTGKDAMFLEIEALRDSMGKVRRKVFCELSETKKLLFSVQTELVDLKNQLLELQSKKMDWEYIQGEDLFTLVERQA